MKSLPEDMLRDLQVEFMEGCAFEDTLEVPELEIKLHLVCWDECGDWGEKVISPIEGEIARYNPTCIVGVKKVECCSKSIENWFNLMNTVNCNLDWIHDDTQIDGFQKWLSPRIDHCCNRMKKNYKDFENKLLDLQKSYNFKINDVISYEALKSNPSYDKFNKIRLW